MQVVSMCKEHDIVTLDGTDLRSRQKEEWGIIFLRYIHFIPLFEGS